MNNTLKPCPPLPRFERVKYFYGQLLGVREFQSEQSYFVDKHRLHNRYLHGYGVVCGLVVAPCKQPPPACPEPERGKRPDKLCVEIGCGLAIDCCGNEITVACATQVDLAKCDDRDKLWTGDWVYVAIRFVEQPLEPVRPLSADSCGGLVPDCVPSRLRDDFCVRISCERPPHDHACTTCDRPCDDPWLPIARVRWHDGVLEIDNGIRRPLATVIPTRIDSLNWVHGATYRPEDVDTILGEGLVIHFTDDVHTHTMQRGVFDIWIIQGGGNRRGDIYNADVEIIPGNPGGEFSRSITARVRSQRGDRIDSCDRVLIQLRSAFLLDRCCRPVDGDHVGGLVPVHGECREPIKRPPATACGCHDPRTLGPWTSGNGTPAGNFESWIYAADDDDEQK